MPTARAGAACAVADQKLVVCGLERNWTWWKQLLSCVPQKKGTMCVETFPEKLLNQVASWRNVNTIFESKT